MAFLDKRMVLSYDQTHQCMKAERVFLSFIAVLVGLVAAGVAFYLYQMTKTLPEKKAEPLGVKTRITPTPTPDKSNFLTVETPKDEEVLTQKTITVSGKTAPNATIIVSSEENDQVVKPAANGDFSLTQAIPEGTSLLNVTAVFASGEEKKVTKTVTYSTENF